MDNLEEMYKFLEIYISQDWRNRKYEQPRHLFPHYSAYAAQGTKVLKDNATDQRVWLHEVHGMARLQGCTSSITARTLVSLA